MMRFGKLLTLTTLLGMLTLPAHADNSYWPEPKEEKDKRMEWWRDARFGMFIHWGLYAVPAGEWKGGKNHAEWIRTTAQIPIAEYDRFVDQFNPVDFDADAWARMARDAGMKYIVITSKHHDGFCLWPSEWTDYDMESTPFKRDIMGELKKACDKYGIIFCMYHSIMDWHHPDYLPRRKWEKDRSSEGADYSRYLEYMNRQLRELVEHYEPGVLWFDGEWEGTFTHEMGKELYEYVRSLDPSIIINNRVDKGRRGMEGLSKEGEYRGDFGTPEQQIPAKGLPGVDWESCMTMNNHWGYNKHDKNFKSTEDLVKKLIDIASKGGNYLLNIGPKADGTFPQESIDRLKEIGEWMDEHGKSIHGTTASPFGAVPFGRVTHKGPKNTLYLHIFEWPEDGQLDLPGMASPVRKARLLGHKGGRVRFSLPDENLVRFELPEERPDAVVPVLEVQYKGDLKAEPYVLRVKANDKGEYDLYCRLGEVVPGHRLRYEKEKDAHGFWSDERDLIKWVTQIEKSGTYTIHLTYACSAGSPGTPVEIRIGKKALRHEIQTTGDWAEFKTVEVGRIEIDQAGSTEVLVKPLAKPKEGVMNLRRIVLKPAP